MSEFARTLRTADDADAIAKLLGRAAVRLNCYADRERLKELARRYTDYAAALRETASDAEECEPRPDQQALL